MRWPARATSSPSASATTPTCGAQRRERALQWGALQSDRDRQKADDPRGVFQTYYEWGQRVERIKPYQVLALNRGEAEKVLRVRVACRSAIGRQPSPAPFAPDRRSPLREHLRWRSPTPPSACCCRRSSATCAATLSERAERARYRRLRRQSARAAQPAAAGRAYRWRHRPRLPHRLQSRGGRRDRQAARNRDDLSASTAAAARGRARRRWLASDAQHGVTLWAIGNGTASRETEQLVAELIRGDAGQRALPDGQRGRAPASTAPARWPAPSCPSWTSACAARSRSRGASRIRWPSWSRSTRQSIGVGLYQHDVDQNRAGHGAGGRGRERGQPRRRGPQYRLARAADLCRRHRAEAGRAHRRLPRRQRRRSQVAPRCARCRGWGRRHSSRRPASCACAAAYAAGR